MLSLYQRRALFYILQKSDNVLDTLKMDLGLHEHGFYDYIEKGYKERVEFLKKHDRKDLVGDEIIYTRLLYAAIGWHEKGWVPGHFDTKSFKKYKDETCYWKTFTNLKKVIDVEKIVKFKAYRVLPPIEIEGCKSKYLESDREWPAKVYLKNGKCEVEFSRPTEISMVDLFYKSRQIILFNLLIIVLLIYFNYLL